MSMFFGGPRNEPRPPRPPRPMPQPPMTPPMPSGPRGGGMSPRPMSPPMPSRRPSSAGGDRDAMIRAYMSRMEMPEQPRVRDMPNMTTEEMAPYNQPAPDVNDAFFGPDRKPFQWTDIIDFLMGRTQGGKR